MENKKSLQSFQDLNAWKQARAVYKSVYTVTRKFPDEDKFTLVSQMRRAAVSAASNIAEGFGRSSMTDNRHFCVMARGSITELQNQCILAYDVGMIADESFEELLYELEIAHKLIVGLIKVTN